jgi:phosphotriesterase-related protein
MKRNELGGKVQTVLGLISPEELGITLPHEHCVHDASTWFEEPTASSERLLAHQPVSLENLGWVRYHPAKNLDNLRLLDERLAIKETLRYKYAGGNSIVDVTSTGLGRDPLGLARISRATGLNIVMGTGYYVEQAVPSGLELTEETMAEEMVRDILEGVGKTGIRAGIIGELGMEWPTGNWEKMVLRAAAKAQNQTGAPVSIHLGKSPDSPFEVIEVLSSAGADISRVVLCHVARTIFDHETLVRLAKTGCYIEYDTFSIEGFGESVRMVFSEANPIKADWPSDAQRVNAIMALIDDGFLNQILISSDMCRKHRLWSYGGPGFAHILENVVPLMREKGMPEEHIRTLLVENPQRLLQFV